VIADDLPAIELQLIWRPETAPPATAILLETARDLARSERWVP
jgi:hypothetical protein